MAIGWQRPVRMDTLGFTREYLNRRLNENYHDPDISYFKRRYPPYKPKAFPLLYEIEELEFTIEHSHDMHEQKRVLFLTDAEWQMLVRCINKARSKYLDEDKPIDDVNMLLVKAMKAKLKKVRV